MTKVVEKSAAQQLVEFARCRGKTAKFWIELHNAVFGIGGRLGELFPTHSERSAFSKSKEFREISELLDSLPGEGSRLPVAGEASGKFVVRLSRSLHAALIAEAQREGVSLNQLCVAKLAMQLQAEVG